MTKFLKYNVESSEIIEKDGKLFQVDTLKFENGATSICYIPYGRTFAEEKEAWLDKFTLDCFRAFRPGYDLSGQTLTLILKDKEEEKECKDI